MGSCQVREKRGRRREEHLFRECSRPAVVHIGESLVQFKTKNVDPREWPGCLSWPDWLLGLSGCSERSPWTGSVCQFAGDSLMLALGADLMVCGAGWSLHLSGARRGISRPSLITRVSDLMLAV